MTIYKNLNELKVDLQNILTFHDPHVTLHKPELIPHAIDKLIYTGVFSNDETLKAKTRKIIRSVAKEKGVISSSIRSFYNAYSEGKVGGFTVPAMNLRILSFDIARSIFRVAKEKNAGAFIFEIARTESEYTIQEPDEFVTVLLAAAIKENYIHPLFIQGDHCQFNADKYTANQNTEIKRIKDWVGRLIEAGFRNIDIDGSTLVDLTKPSLHAQQKNNAFVTAEMTEFIRKKEHEMHGFKNASPIAIGGEIGHIGEKNSTVEDFEAFMNQYLNQIARGSGISKVSVQTGTSHGGLVNPYGKIQTMVVDFSVLQSIGNVARRKYHMSGPVQHGASTLPIELFHKFVEAKTVEIHLSTGFQNIVYDTMPKDLQKEMYAWLKKNHKTEWKEGWSEKQFIYKTRKKAWGAFKKHLWYLAEKEKRPIIEAIEQYVETIFDKLNACDTAMEVEKYTNNNQL